MAWLRRHRKRKHPRLHKKSTAKMLRTKKGGSLMRKMRTNKRIGSRIKRKWGKIGAPKSAKRKAFLATVRRKKRK
jgi:hypothetical protein